MDLVDFVINLLIYDLFVKVFTNLIEKSKEIGVFKL